jgi:hypothetical protein
MAVLGFICLIIIAIFAILWLYRKTSTATKYTKTAGEIIDLRNIVPLVNKTLIDIGGSYAHTECVYQGDVYVTVRFINRDGEELTRRYNSSDPVLKKINEHEHSVPKYTSAFPDWQIGRRIKLLYDPANTADIFVGKVLRHNKNKKGLNTSRRIG